MNKKNKGVIPFYGGDKQKLFEIERRCMDRDGKVVAHLRANLPTGCILDVGAGNGFTAAKLQCKDRIVYPIEPNLKMIDRKRALPWVRGKAQQLPFAKNTFDGAYATWAFFLNGVAGIDLGLLELERVIRSGGLIIVIDNAGDDEFCSYSKNTIWADRQFWLSHKFQETIIETSWRFDNEQEASLLFKHFFGDVNLPPGQTVFQYRVAAFAKNLA